MSQGAYLLIEIAALVFLAAIITLTSVDVIWTRQQRKLAGELLERAQDKAFRDRAAREKNPESSKSPDVDEMKILHDIVFPHAITPDA